MERFRVGLSLAVFAGIWIATAAPSAAVESVEGRATVVDGDTIEVSGVDARVRLYGIDTPEDQQTCRDGQGQRYLCGSRAAQALADLMGRNNEVSCLVEDVDRYGRLVAECRLKRGAAPRGTNLNRALVRQGWALEYTRYSDGRYADDEEAAKRDGVGLWQGTFVAPWDWRRGSAQPFDPSAGPGEAGSPARTAQRSCASAATCREAVVMWCNGYRRADRDKDGIPCESVCRSKQQVDQIREEFGC